MKSGPSLRARTAAATLIALLLTAAMAPAAAPPQGSELSALLEEITEYRRAGDALPLPPGVDERYADRFPAVSLEQFATDLERHREFRDRLAQLDRDALTPSERIDAQILAMQLRDRIAELEHRGYLLPLGSRSGFHFGFASAPESWGFDDVEDYDRYVARMQSFLEHTRGQIALMREGIREGWVMPAVILDGYTDTAARHVTATAADSAFAGPLREFPAAVSATDRERLLADGMRAIEESVLPAYRELADFFREEYVPAGRPGIGVSELPGGEAFYAHRVRRYTTLDLTAAEVHEIGHREVRRMRAEMDAIRDEVGFTGSHLEFVDMLRREPRFQAATEAEYLARVALAAKEMEGHLPRLFRRLPVTPYGIRAMPAHVAPRQSAGYYDRGAADGTRGGWVNINTSMLPTRPTWVARPLAFHEGVPGHHLQIMLALENPEISEFRRGAGVTVFVEGWGLYAERLGLDVGLYDDPYDRFGMWSYQIWRACRLVVDTGMHALGWDRQRAIDFMAENTGMAPEAVAAEIDRHITEPGQGLAYTMGELVISRLRQEAESRLGDAFDVREFHDVVLRNGPVPLVILEAETRGWIERAANRSDG